MNSLTEAYGGRIRVRVGALLFDSVEDPEQLLLVKHTAPNGGRSFWTPPGGAVEFGESISEALIREVAEETGLQIEVEELLYTLDFVRPPLHAVSFYFRSRSASGELAVGADPELHREDQFIEEVRYIPFSQVDHHVTVPEGLIDNLLRDIRSSEWTGTARYLGTRR